MLQSMLGYPEWNPARSCGMVIPQRQVTAVKKKCVQKAVNENISLYVPGYINPYYWVDFPIPYGNNGSLSLDPSTYKSQAFPTRPFQLSFQQTAGGQRFSLPWGPDPSGGPSTVRPLKRGNSNKGSWTGNSKHHEFQGRCVKFSGGVFMSNYCLFGVNLAIESDYILYQLLLAVRPLEEYLLAKQYHGR